MLTLLSTNTWAKDPLPLNPASPWYGANFDTGWHYDIGIGLESEPSYAGSDKQVTEAGFSARALYRSPKGHRYFIGLGEVGAVLALSPKLQFLAFLEYEEGRTDEEDSTLTGLDDIDSTIEGQLMLSRRFGNASLFGILQPDVSGDANKGLVWFLGGSYDFLSKNQRWRISNTLDISGANSEYMQTEFGITNTESAATGLATYTPSSGLKSLTWNLSGEYYFTKQLSLLASIDTEYYLDDAANSPLIADEGSDLNNEASVILRYTF